MYPRCSHHWHGCKKVYRDEKHVCYLYKGHVANECQCDCGATTPRKEES